MLSEDYKLASMLEMIHGLDAMSRIIAINVAVHAEQMQIAGCDITIGIDDCRSDGILSSWLSDRGRRMP